MGFVRCNVANNDSVSLYPTLCTLVLGGGGYLLLGMILKHSFGKSVYWVLYTKKNVQILLETSCENNTQIRQLESSHKFKTFITAVKISKIRKKNSDAGLVQGKNTFPDLA